MRKFIFDSEIKTKDNLVGFQLNWEGDSTLVSNFEAAFKAGFITRIEWSKVNKCWQYINIFMVAIITSGDGRSINDGVFKRTYITR